MSTTTHLLGEARQLQHKLARLGSAVGMRPAGLWALRRLRGIEGCWHRSG